MEVDLIDETIDACKSLEALDDILELPKKFPNREYVVATLVHQSIRKRHVLLSNKLKARQSDLEEGKLHFEKLIEYISSAQLEQLGLTQSFAWSQNEFQKTYRETNKY